jgi:hypothetical protein
MRDSIGDFPKANLANISTPEKTSKEAEDVRPARGMFGKDWGDVGVVGIRSTSDN